MHCRRRGWEHDVAVLKSGSAQIYFEVMGAGPPLVLIAGYCCDHTFWDLVRPALARDFQVIALDNRAVGQTRDDGAPLTAAIMAADVAALIEHLGLQRPALAGQSMGGAVVQSLIAQHPHACGPCAILNSTARFSAAANLAMRSLLALRANGVDLDLILDAALPWMNSSEWLAKPGNIAGFKQAIKNAPHPQSLQDQGRQMAVIEGFDARPVNAPHAWPTLVVNASDDVLVPVRAGRELAAALAATFVEIPGGHASPVEQPDRLVDLLHAFFTRRKGSS
jgi:pimeloyl-ACP methyl ester carboxylesterase